MLYRSRTLVVITLATLAASTMGGAIASRLPASNRKASIPVDSSRPTALTFEQQFEASDDSKPKQREQFTIYRNANGEIVCRRATPDEIQRMNEVDSTKLGLRQINHLNKKIPTQPGENDGTGLNIILRATAQLQQNPTAVNAFTMAAQNWENIILSPITIYIDVDYGPTYFGESWPPGVLGATSAPAQSYPYQSVRTNLIAEATDEGNVTKQSIFNALPSTTVPTDLGNASGTIVSDSTGRAIGLLPATAQSTDLAARIGFNSSFSFDFEPSDGVTPGQIDFDAVATHEIGHALGFHSEAGLNLPKPSIWDLYRFRTGTDSSTFSTAQRILTIGGSPDPLQYDFIPGNPELGLSTGGPNGSTNNGGDGWQSSHWKHSSTCSPYIGIMDPAISSGCRRTITGNDILALTSFGYNLTNTTPPPPPPPTPTPPANDNFANRQVFSGCSGNLTGTTFSATSEPGEPSHDPSDSSSGSPGQTVWYQWQAPSSVSLNTNITTAGSDFDTILAVYTGASLGSLTRITFNDDATPGSVLTSSVTFSATAGTTYQIVVDGWGGDSGTVKLNWSGCPVPTPTPTPTPTPSPSPGTCPGPAGYTVNDNGDANDAALSDGLCATAGGSCTLRAAMQEANTTSGCVVNINLGSISGTINLATPLPDINTTININGPGANSLTVQRSTAGGTPNFRIFSINSGKTVAISGLTISNGLLPGGNGGGVLNNGGTLTMTDCNIYGNSVGTSEGSGAGGGIYNSGSLGHNSGSLVLNNCRIGSTIAGQANTSGANGGGISSVSTFQMNGGSIGGNSESGIYIGEGPATLVGVTVSNNSARNTGAGIRVGGTATVANIIGCTIANNGATYGGAGIYNGGATVMVINSTVSGNISNQFAGGIYSFNATNTTLINTTVTNNRSTSGNGGGLQNSGGVLLKNSIISGNFIGPAPGTTPDDLRDLVNTTSSSNLIGTCNGCGLTNGANNNQLGVSNPGLGPLANNGGLTMTHALLVGGPAINAGSNALALDQNGNPLTTDQRGVGFSRIVNGAVDIGAFEFGPPQLFTDANNHVIAIDSVMFVREPFSVVGSHNFSSDQRTRVMIFTSHLGLNQPSPDLSVQAGGITLSVEGVGTLPGVPSTSYIIIKLDPLLIGDLQLTVTFQGVTSNAGVISISP
ncbi:MAG: NF038122 family metalloprotease [Pyrinomonadaceae bacterium]